MMRISVITFLIPILISSAHAIADTNALHTALEESVNTVNNNLNTMRNSCSGISSDLNHLKILAGVGTGLSSAGTVSSGTAGVAGIIKHKSDKQAMELSAKDLWEQIHNNSKTNPTHTELSQDQVSDYETWFKSLTPTDADHKTNIAHTKQQLRQLTEAGQKGEKMGHLRTGTLATSAVLNIAGATVSGIDIKKNATITERISNCLNATQELSRALMQLKMNKNAYDADIANTSTPQQKFISDTEITNIQNIINACNNWSTVDLSKIEKQAKAATVSNIVGAATSTTGAITSAISNTDANRLSGTDKEKNLNITSNTMTVGSTVAGITATIFNATQINKIKQAVSIADECEGALQTK
jgi:hypothetical protein